MLLALLLLLQNFGSGLRLEVVMKVYTVRVAKDDVAKDATVYCLRTKGLISNPKVLKIASSLIINNSERQN